MRSTFYVLGLAGLALSSPTGMAARAACDLPAWTISNLTATFGAEVQTGGRCTWAFTDKLTNKTDTLTCSLRANSRCEVVGTPSNPSAHIYLQIAIDMAYWTVNQTWSCETSK
jgi:hypothetical protein